MIDSCQRSSTQHLPVKMLFLTCIIDFFLIAITLGEDCGLCRCEPSLQTIYCQGREITEVDSIPDTFHSYSRLVLRDTEIIKLPDNICQWKLREIFMRGNLLFDCESLEYCAHILYDIECQKSSSEAFETIFTSPKSEKNSVFTVQAESTSVTNSVKAENESAILFLIIGILAGILGICIILGISSFFIWKKISVSNDSREDTASTLGVHNLNFDDDFSFHLVNIVYWI